MSMHGYDVSFYDYGFSDPAISSSLYGNLLSPMAAAIDYDDDAFVRRRPPPTQRPPSETPSSPPKHRHDGTSPLPLGMDWSLPPRIWDGKNSVWPHDSPKGWSYCVTVPSWTILPSGSGSDTVFFRVQVGIQSPEGITTTRGVLRRFNEFLKLYTELRKEFPKKILPPAPPRRLMKMRSKTLLEERRRALEDWVEKLLSDIDVSRTALVAIFLELEAAARSSFDELNQNEPLISSLESSSSIASGFDNTCAYKTSDLSAPRPETEKYACKTSNSRLSSLNESNLEHPESVEDLQGDLAVVLPSDERKNKLNRVLITMQQKLGTTKTDMEDLVARLLKELDDAKEQAEILKKQHDEMELKSKLEVKHLVTEGKSLRTSHSELKRELSKCMEEKVELQKEKQRQEIGNASKVKLLQECEVLRNQLQECSVNFLVDEEDKLIVDTSVSDAMSLLETSDNRVDHLLAEARLLARDAETTTGAADQDYNGDGSTIRDDKLRLLLADIFSDNVKLRKQVNSVIHHALSKSGKILNDNVEDDAPVKTALDK